MMCVRTGLESSVCNVARPLCGEWPCVLRFSGRWHTFPAHPHRHTKISFCSVVPVRQDYVELKLTLKAALTFRTTNNKAVRRGSTKAVSKIQHFGKHEPRLCAVFAQKRMGGNTGWRDSRSARRLIWSCALRLGARQIQMLPRSKWLLPV